MILKPAWAAKIFLAGSSDRGVPTLAGHRLWSVTSDAPSCSSPRIAKNDIAVVLAPHVRPSLVRRSPGLCAFVGLGGAS